MKTSKLGTSQRLLHKVTAISCLMALPASAAFTFTPFAGPFNVTTAGFTLAVNDAANSAGVTPGLYGSFTVTADWAAGGGDPWSSEAEILFSTSSDSIDIDPPTSGAFSSGAATTLTFSGGLPGLYDPSVDGFIELFMDQSFGGSDANWSNISITLENFVPPTPPTTLMSFSMSGSGAFATATTTYDGPAIAWYEVVYDGAQDITFDTEGSSFDTEIGVYDSNGFLLGSDDDGGTDLLSSLTLSGQPAGTYYVAAGGWNTVFGTGFNPTSNSGTVGGTLTVNFSTIPEPSSAGFLLLSLLGITAIRRRR